MKTYELNAGEIELVLSALRYTAEYGYTAELTDGEIDEYHDILALIQKLDPKPVKKHAWMVVYDDESKRGLFDTESEAQGWARHAPTRSKVVEVTWEE